MTQSPDVLQEAAIEAAFRAIAGDEADPHMCPEAWEHAETVALAVLSTLPQQAATDEGEGFTPMIEWVVELARRDIKREQTDFIGRMNQAMGEFEAICDDYPDGELNEAARDDAGEALAALAGLAIAQLAMVNNPSDPLSMLSTPPSQEQAKGEAQGVWMAIGSAPKDGTPFLAKGHDWGMPTNRQHFAFACYDEARAEFRDWFDEDASLAYLTDWMPGVTPPGHDAALSTTQRGEE